MRNAPPARRRCTFFSRPARLTKRSAEILRSSTSMAATRTWRTCARSSTRSKKLDDRSCGAGGSERLAVDDLNRQRQRVELVDAAEVHPTVADSGAPLVVRRQARHAAEWGDSAPLAEIVKHAPVAELIDAQRLLAVEVEGVGGNVLGRAHEALAHADGAVAATA